MHIPNIHIPVQKEACWLESFEDHSNTPTPSLDSIASEFFGRTYIGQQTDDCLPRGTESYSMRTHAECTSAMNGQEGVDLINEWLSKDYDSETRMTRDAPGIEIVLAHLILNEKLPYGEYLINIDW